MVIQIDAKWPKEYIKWQAPGKRKEGLTSLTWKVYMNKASKGRGINGH